MANLYCTTRKSQGVILITTLLLILVIILLMFGMLRTGLLDAKMLTNYQARFFALRQVEMNLHITLYYGFASQGTIDKRIWCVKRTRLFHEIM